MSRSAPSLCQNPKSSTTTLTILRSISPVTVAMLVSLESSGLITTVGVAISPAGTALGGVVSHKRMDKSYGFIRVEGCGEWDGPEYFFHDNDISDGTSFAELAEGELVDFEVKADPPAGKAPPARLVRRRPAPAA